MNSPVVLRRVLRSARLSWGMWAAAVVAVCAIYVGLYPSMEKVDMGAMLAALPPALVESLGFGDMTTAAGYVGSTIYQMVGFVLLLIFAIRTGARLIAGEEQDGHLELELTTQNTRLGIFVQRLLALWAQLAGLAAVVWLSIIAIDLLASLQLPRGAVAFATGQLWLVLTLFGTAAFSLGAITGRRGVSLGAAAGALVVSWMLNALGPMLGHPWMAEISPVGWYMDQNPITRPIAWVDSALLVGTTLALALAGAVVFQRRDLMRH